MYGVALTTTVDPGHPEYWNEVRANLDQIVENARNKVEARERGVYKKQKKDAVKKELDIALELSETLSEATPNVLNKAQKELYITFRDFAAQHQSDFMRNARGVWGNEDFQWYRNYIPTIALGRKRTGDISSDTLIRHGANNLWDGVQTGTPQYSQLASRQAGANKKRTAPQGYFYDYDLMSVAHKFASSELTDLYTTREAKILNHLLSGAQGSPVKNNEGKSIHDVMSVPAIDGLIYQVKNIIGASQVTDAEVNDLLKGVLKIKDTFATAVLATTGQFLVQASSALPAAIIMSPKGFGKAMAMLTKFERGKTDLSSLKQWLDDNGLSIQLRDALFERFQTIEDVQKRGISRGMGKWRALADEMTTYALRSGDKWLLD
jgi:dsDNA-binding SOS-regulon protein